MRERTMSRDNSNIFFFNDTATTEIYTLSLHDALPICFTAASVQPSVASIPQARIWTIGLARSEEHTSELQSPGELVCRLQIEKKKQLHRSRPQISEPVMLIITHQITEEY